MTFPRSISLASDRVAVRAFWASTFALLTAVGAQIEIPHAPVPYTAQTFFVLLAGGLLGPWTGARNAAQRKAGDCRKVR